MHPILFYISNSMLMIFGIMVLSLGLFIGSKGESIVAVTVSFVGMLIIQHSYKSVMESLNADF